MIKENSKKSCKVIFLSFVFYFAFTLYKKFISFKPEKIRYFNYDIGLDFRKIS